MCNISDTHRTWLVSSIEETLKIAASRGCVWGWQLGSETGIDGSRNQQPVWSCQEKRLLSAVFSKLCFLPLGHFYDQGFLLWKLTKLTPDVLQHLCKHHHLLMTCHFLVPSGSLQFWCFKSDIPSKHQGFAAEPETSSHAVCVLLQMQNGATKVHY